MERLGFVVYVGLGRQAEGVIPVRLLLMKGVTRMKEGMLESDAEFYDELIGTDPKEQMMVLVEHHLGDMDILGATARFVKPYLELSIELNGKLREKVSQS